MKMSFIHVRMDGTSQTNANTRKKTTAENDILERREIECMYTHTYTQRIMHIFNFKCDERIK